jgi:hypothetical protein
MGHRSRQVQSDRDVRINAYAELLRSSVDVHDHVAGPWREGQIIEVGWTDWNRSLAVVALVAPAHVAEAAHRIDEAYWRLGRQVGPGPMSQDQWEGVAEQMERARLNFVNEARRELIGPRSGLDRVGGRPPANDPIWRAAELRQAEALPPA